MPDVWSITTTVRNPERLIEFLEVLNKFEGQNFNKETQKLYQKELIKHKYYQPNNIPQNLKQEYENSEEFDEEKTEIIFSYVNNPDLRGRTSASKLNQMCLAIAKQKSGNVVITDLGKNVLCENISLEELFLKYFLKWQLPNPLEKNYEGFDLSPFLCTLDIIYKVNKIEEKLGNKSKGLSKQEFAIFIVTLKNYKDIDKVVNEIIEYRKKLKTSSNKNEIYKKTIEEKVSSVFGLNKKDDKINTKCNNLEDYADSAIRWFRMTQLLYYRGDKRYIDISPSRVEEVKKILEVLPKNSKKYHTEEDYINFIVDENLSTLPWENPDSFLRIIKNLAKMIESYQNRIDNEFPKKRIHTFEINPKINTKNLNELKKIEKTFRFNLNTIINEYRTLKESDLSNLKKYIYKLDDLGNNIRPRNKINDAPLCLEWYISLSLMALNDAIEIRPNFSRGDDGLPTFTAPGGVPDIECYYKTFNIIVEVTLMNGRNQFMGEVQPILRHYKDFNEKNKYKQSYLLFIAPSLYRDTKNHLEFYIKNSYEGFEVNLVPLTINLYNKMLKIVLEKFKLGKFVTHEKLEEFFKTCIQITKTVKTYDWETSIENELDNWKNNLN